MKRKKKQALERAGFRVGSAKEFLGMTDAESALVDLRMSLADVLKRLRQTQHLTQIAFARLLRSSQSRVAKMESGDPSVSLDLLIRSLIVLGTDRRHLASIVSGGLRNIAA